MPWTDFFVEGSLSHGGRYGGADCLAFDAEHAPLAWPPSLQACNFVGINTALLLIVWLVGRGERSSPERGSAKSAGRSAAESQATALDTALYWFAMLVFSAKVVFGALGNKFVTVVNPCHALNLGHALALRGRGERQSRLALYMMPWVMGAWCAIASPDPEAQFTGELVHFWAEHLLVTFVLPVYFTVRDGTAAANPTGVLGQLNFATAVRATACYFAYSTVLLMPLSRLTTVNLNYMLCPPEPIEGMGSYYMLFWSTVGFPCCTLCTYVMIGIGWVILYVGAALGLTSNASSTNTKSKRA